MKKNVASQIVGAQLNSKTDGSAVTTGTTTVYVTGDGGTQAAGSVGSGACTHEGQGFWTYAPAQAETNYDHVAFTFTNTNAVAATVQIYTTFPQTGDSYARLGAPAGASVSADVAAVKTDTAAIKLKTDNLPSDPADASDISASLTTITGYIDTEVASILAAVDTEVAAIKAKTDSLTFTVAGMVDANIQAVNDTTVVGDGSGTPWGP